MPDFLQRARDKYGERVSGMSDAELAKFLHSLIAPDVPFDVFAGRNGIKLDKPGYVGAVARAAVQGATANFSDELRGLGAAIVPGGDTYSTAVAKEREALRAGRDAYPASTLTAEIGGGLATALVPGTPIARMVAAAGRAPTVGRAVGGVAKMGALEGALYGAGAGEGEGKIAGAVAGAALGAPAGVVGYGLTNSVVGAARLAKNLVTKGDLKGDAARMVIAKLKADVPDAFAGKSDEEALRLLALQADPEGIMAEYSYGMGRATRGGMAVNNPQNAATSELLERRVQDAVADVEDAFRSGAGVSEVDEAGYSRMLTDRKRANAQGAYDAAYAIGNVQDDEINKALLILRDTDTVMRDVAKTWQQTLAADDIATRLSGGRPAQGLDRALIGMDTNGAVILNPEYATVRNLDLLKRTLDTEVSKLYGPGGNPTLARSVRELRDRIVGRLDYTVGEYKAARATFAGDLEAEQAFQEGLKAARSTGNWNPSRLRDYISKLDATSKEMFQTAYFTKELEKAAGNRGGLLAHFRDPSVLPRLRAVFDGDMGRLEAMINTANARKATQNLAEAGSRTAPVLDDMNAVAGAENLKPLVNLGAGLTGAALRDVVGSIATRPSVRTGRAAEVLNIMRQPQVPGMMSLADQARADIIQKAIDRVRGARTASVFGYGAGQVGGMVGK